MLLAVNGTLMRGLELNPNLLAVGAVWDVPPAGLADVLIKEPPGLCIGKVTLEDGGEALGVLGEPAGRTTRGSRRASRARCRASRSRPA